MSSESLGPAWAYAWLGDLLAEPPQPNWPDTPEQIAEHGRRSERHDRCVAAERARDLRLGIRSRMPGSLYDRPLLFLG